jgi:hypothetical protein
MAPVELKDAMWIELELKSRFIIRKGTHPQIAHFVSCETAVQWLEKADIGFV